MAITLSVFLGIAAAVSVHWLAWWLRLQHLSWTVVAGAFGVIAITALGLVYVLLSDIGHLVFLPLVLFWGFAVLFGIFQAAAIPAPWWMGILGLLSEMAMGILALSVLNLSMQRIAIGWRMAERFPEVFGYPERIRDRVLFVFLAVFVSLALVRPVARLRRLVRERIP